MDFSIVADPEERELLERLHGVFAGSYRFKDRYEKGERKDQIHLFEGVAELAKRIGLRNESAELSFEVGSDGLTRVILTAGPPKPVTGG
jgi:hypothetical protein